MMYDPLVGDGEDQSLHVVISSGSWGVLNVGNEEALGLIYVVTANVKTL